MGLLFGIFLVVCQELAYQYRLQEQYKEASLVTGVPKPTSSPVIDRLMAALRPELTPGETDAGAQDSDLPPGYRHSASGNGVTIELGNEALTIDFVALKSANEDFVGWFMIPGTDISYPVVQGQDNSFYLKHIFDGSYGTVGTLFMDCRNVILEDENTMIHGHNFHQYGAMFSKLIYYEKQEYYSEHPVMYYLTQEGGYAIEIFSVYEASTSDAIYTFTFSTDKEYKAFLDHVTEKSAIRTDVKVTAQDKVMTLSTCSNKDSNGRFVVVGKIVAFG